MGYAIVFAGQGNQHAGMMPWLPVDAGASAALCAMQRLLGAHWRSALADARLSARNRFAQILLTGTGLAAWELLRPLLPGLPAAAAGYSVGELAAYASAGVLSTDDALALAAQRADCMDRAARGQAAGLLSVSGAPVAQLVSSLPGLHCAIRIDQDHALFGGTSEALEQARQQLEAAGLRCQRLPVQVASHTPLMALAAQDFAALLQPVAMQPAQWPIVLNASARACRRVPDLKPALALQIGAMVDWAGCMDALAAQGVRCVLEIGPGHALAGMWNRRHPTIAARALAEFQSPAGAAAWVRKNLV